MYKRKPRSRKKVEGDTYKQSELEEKQTGKRVLTELVKRGSFIGTTERRGQKLIRRNKLREACSKYISEEQKTFSSCKSPVQSAAGWSKCYSETDFPVSVTCDHPYSRNLPSVEPKYIPQADENAGNSGKLNLRRREQSPDLFEVPIGKCRLSDLSFLPRPWIKPLDSEIIIPDKVYSKKKKNTSEILLQRQMRKIRNHLFIYSFLTHIAALYFIEMSNQVFKEMAFPIETAKCQANDLSPELQEIRKIWKNCLLALIKEGGTDSVMQIFLKVIRECTKDCYSGNKEIHSQSQTQSGLYVTSYREKFPFIHDLNPFLPLTDPLQLVDSFLYAMTLIVNDAPNVSEYFDPGPGNCRQYNSLVTFPMARVTFVGDSSKVNHDSSNMQPHLFENGTNQSDYENCSRNRERYTDSSSDANNVVTILKKISSSYGYLSFPDANPSDNFIISNNDISEYNSQGQGQNEQELQSNQKPQTMVMNVEVFERQFQSGSFSYSGCSASITNDRFPVEYSCNVKEYEIIMIHRMARQTLLLFPECPNLSKIRIFIHKENQSSFCELGSESQDGEDYTHSYEEIVVSQPDFLLTDCSNETKSNVFLQYDESNYDASQTIDEGNCLQNLSPISYRIRSLVADVPEMKAEKSVAQKSACEITQMELTADDSQKVNNKSHTSTLPSVNHELRHEFSNVSQDQHFQNHGNQFNLKLVKDKTSKKFQLTSKSSPISEQAIKITGNEARDELKNSQIPLKVKNSSHIPFKNDGNISFEIKTPENTDHITHRNTNQGTSALRKVRKIRTRANKTGIDQTQSLKSTETNDDAVKRLEYNFPIATTTDANYSRINQRLNVSMIENLTETTSKITNVSLYDLGGNVQNEPTADDSHPNQIYESPESPVDQLYSCSRSNETSDPHSRCSVIVTVENKMQSHTALDLSLKNNENVSSSTEQNNIIKESNIKAHSSHKIYPTKNRKIIQICNSTSKDCDTNEPKCLDVVSVKTGTTSAANDLETQQDNTINIINSSYNVNTLSEDSTLVTVPEKGLSTSSELKCLDRGKSKADHLRDAVSSSEYSPNLVITKNTDQISLDQPPNFQYNDPQTNTVTQSPQIISRSTENSSTKPVTENYILVSESSPTACEAKELSATLEQHSSRSETWKEGKMLQAFVVRQLMALSSHPNYKIMTEEKTKPPSKINFNSQNEIRNTQMEETLTDQDYFSCIKITILQKNPIKNISSLIMQKKLEITKPMYGSMDTEFASPPPEDTSVISTQNISVTNKNPSVTTEIQSIDQRTEEIINEWLEGDCLVTFTPQAASTPNSTKRDDDKLKSFVFTYKNQKIYVEIQDEILRFILEALYKSNVPNLPDSERQNEFVEPNEKALCLPIKKRKIKEREELVSRDDCKDLNDTNASIIYQSYNSSKYLMENNSCSLPETTQMVLPQECHPCIQVENIPVQCSNSEGTSRRSEDNYLPTDSNLRLLTINTDSSNHPSYFPKEKPVYSILALHENEEQLESHEKNLTIDSRGRYSSVSSINCIVTPRFSKDQISQEAPDPMLSGELDNGLESSVNTQNFNTDVVDHHGSSNCITLPPNNHCDPNLIWKSSPTEPVRLPRARNRKIQVAPNTNNILSKAGEKYASNSLTKRRAHSESLKAAPNTNKELSKVVNKSASSSLTKKRRCSQSPHSAPNAEREDRRFYQRYDRRHTAGSQKKAINKVKNNSMETRITKKMLSDSLFQNPQPSMSEVTHPVPQIPHDSMRLIDTYKETQNSLIPTNVLGEHSQQCIFPIIQSDIADIESNRSIVRQEQEPDIGGSYTVNKQTTEVSPQHPNYPERRNPEEPPLPGSVQGNNRNICSEREIDQLPTIQNPDIQLPESDLNFNQMELTEKEEINTGRLSNINRQVTSQYINCPTETITVRNQRTPVVSPSCPISPPGSNPTEPQLPSYVLGKERQKCSQLEINSLIANEVNPATNIDASSMPIRHSNGGLSRFDANVLEPGIIGHPSSVTITPLPMNAYYQNINLGSNLIETPLTQLVTQGSRIIPVSSNLLTFNAGNVSVPNTPLIPYDPQFQLGSYRLLPNCSGQIMPFEEKNNIIISNVEHDFVQNSIYTSAPNRPSHPTLQPERSVEHPTSTVTFPYERASARNNPLNVLNQEVTANNAVPIMRSQHQFPECTLVTVHSDTSIEHPTSTVTSSYECASAINNSLMTNVFNREATATYTVPIMRPQHHYIENRLVTVQPETSIEHPTSTVTFPYESASAINNPLNVLNQEVTANNTVPIMSSQYNFLGCPLATVQPETSIEHPTSTVTFPYESASAITNPLNVLNQEVTANNTVPIMSSVYNFLGCPLTIVQPETSIENSTSTVTFPYESASAITNPLNVLNQEVTANNTVPIMSSQCNFLGWPLATVEPETSIEHPTSSVTFPYESASARYNSLMTNILNKEATTNYTVPVMRQLLQCPLCILNAALYSLSQEFTRRMQITSRNDCEIMTMPARFGSNNIPAGLSANQSMLLDIDTVNSMGDGSNAHVGAVPSNPDASNMFRPTPEPQDEPLDYSMKTLNQRSQGNKL